MKEIEQAKLVGYSEEEIRSIPEDAIMGHGCGNPTALAVLKEGEIVLDLGSGGGIDVFLAANKVGEDGKVIGVDMTREMVEKSITVAREGGYENVEFKVGEIENLPLKDESIDIVISNCVINDTADKLVSYKEAFRVLKPDGRVLISDLVIEGEFGEIIRRSLSEVWSDWIAKALDKEEYLDAMKKAGFADVKVVVERPYLELKMHNRFKGKINSIQVKAHK